MKRAVFVISFLFLSGLAAMAQQLILVSPENAEKAAAYINKQKEVILYCGCCNNDRPLKVKVAEAAVEQYQNLGTGVRLKGSDHDLNVIDQFVDLAQVWVKHKGVGVNLGKVMNLRCNPCLSTVDWKTMTRNNLVELTTKLSSVDRSHIQNLTNAFTSTDTFSLHTREGVHYKIYDSQCSFDSVFNRLIIRYKAHNKEFYELQYTIDFANLKKVKSKGNSIILKAKKGEKISLSQSSNSSIVAQTQELDWVNLAFVDPNMLKGVKKSIKALIRSFK